MKNKKTKTVRKICWANSLNFDSSDIIVIGIPDEMGSHASRKGSSLAPDTIRKISNQMDIYTHKKTTSLATTTSGLSNLHIFDYGNIRKNQVEPLIDELAGDKIPMVIGGDHSNTFPIIKALGKKLGPISLVYFDAHPDMIGSRGSYYGSTVFDSLPYIDTKSSALVGIRSPEIEETNNIKKHELFVITPADIVEKGITQIAETLLRTIKNNVYISLDMDCIDPAYAPGVSVPVPLGLSSLDVMYLLKKISQRGIIGLDIMEVCPPHDLNYATSHLASRLVGEVISSCKV